MNSAPDSAAAGKNLRVASVRIETRIYPPVGIRLTERKSLLELILPRIEKRGVFLHEQSMTDAHLRMCSKFGTETEYPRRQAIVAGGKSKPETGKIPVPGISAFGPVRDTLPVQKEPAALIRAEIEDEFLFTFLCLGLW